MAPRRLPSVLLLALWSASPASAQVRVLSPSWLVKELPDGGRIEGSTATFGAPFYGDRVMGRLVYGEPKSNHPHCTEDDYEVPPPLEYDKASKEGEARLINIVLVKRGECSFTQKVRVASAKQAHAVIIADKEESDITPETIHNIVVADDGFGDKITIPSVLVTKEVGKTLIQAVVAGAKVIVELAWDLPTNHVVQLDLWMSSASLTSNRFLKQFAPMRRTLNQVVNFQPHYAVFSLDSTDPNIYNDLCFDDKGTFCAEDPDLTGPVTGKEVLAEDVRQMCIHVVHKVQQVAQRDISRGHQGVEYSKKYWDYIERIHDDCPLDGEDAERRFGEVCSKRLQASLGIDVDTVDKCVREKGLEILKDQLLHTAWSPRAMRINGWRYSGILDAELVTRAICSGFIKRPQECEDLLDDRDPTIPYGTAAPAEGVSTRQLLFWIMVVCAAIGVAFQVYKVLLKRELQQRLREEVMLEVQAQMGEYQKMAGR